MQNAGMSQENSGNSIVSSLFRPFRHLLYGAQRLVASARAGSFLGRFRRGVRFAATAIDQDGVLLLMPREPSLAFIWVPLAIVFTAGGALLGALT